MKETLLGQICELAQKLSVTEVRWTYEKHREYLQSMTCERITPEWPDSGRWHRASIALNLTREQATQLMGRLQDTIQKFETIEITGIRETKEVEVSGFPKAPRKRISKRDISV